MPLKNSSTGTPFRPYIWGLNRTVNASERFRGCTQSGGWSTLAAKTKTLPWDLKEFPNNGSSIWSTNYRYAVHLHKLQCRYIR